MRDKIMILDTNDLNRSTLGNILCSDYVIIETKNAAESFIRLKESENELAAVLIDMLTSEEDGYQLLKAMQENSWNKNIPILVVCDSAAIKMEKELFAFGVSECINQPFDDALIRLKVSNIVKLFQYQNELENKINQQTEKLRLQNQMLKIQADFLQKSNLRITDLLGTMAEYRNLESGEHIQRVKIYTRILAEELIKEDPSFGLTPEKISLIVSASPLHDIGKIAIPDTILLKPGKLTDEEYEYVKSHTISGCEILENIKDIWSKEYAQISMEICRYHHERYDGNGYPDGLKGDEIPIHAQIVSVADVYDALVNERVYKSAIPKDRAFRMIINGECGIFSPILLTCLTNCRAQMEAV
ncbi:MAG: HD domain-containing protein [bacterium]|nr:HD domain-containing protein [bacterium]MDY4100040.1 HD domain-containing protein [Lachnospiraceae bacterium]